MHENNTKPPPPPHSFHPCPIISQKGQNSKARKKRFTKAVHILSKLLLAQGGLACSLEHYTMYHTNNIFLDNDIKPWYFLNFLLQLYSRTSYSHLAISLHWIVPPPSITCSKKWGESGGERQHIYVKAPCDHLETITLWPTTKCYIIPHISILFNFF